MLIKGPLLEKVSLLGGGGYNLRSGEFVLLCFVLFCLFWGGGAGVLLMYASAVTKISSCRVNTTSRRGIKQLGISFGSIFLPFSYESSRGKYPAPGPKMTAMSVCVV